MTDHAHLLYFMVWQNVPYSMEQQGVWQRKGEVLQDKTAVVGDNVHRYVVQILMPSHVCNVF